jgi:hypothetical protein
MSWRITRSPPSDNQTRGFSTARRAALRAFVVLEGQDPDGHDLAGVGSAVSSPAERHALDAEMPNSSARSADRTRAIANELDEPYVASPLIRRESCPCRQAPPGSRALAIAGGVSRPASASSKADEGSRVFARALSVELSQNSRPRALSPSVDRDPASVRCRRSSLDARGRSSSKCSIRSGRSSSAVHDHAGGVEAPEAARARERHVPVLDEQLLVNLRV